MSDEKTIRAVFTSYDAPESTEDMIGGYNARRKGCLCKMVRQRYDYDGTKTDDGKPGYYGHAMGILEGGKGYFMSIINPQCPLHGDKEKLSDGAKGGTNAD